MSQMVVAHVLRILLVEDNDADAYLVREALRQCGIEFELLHMKNGEQALRHMLGADTRPDLVLLDLHLPGTDGPQILRTIRSVPRLDDMPVVVVSGASTDWLKGVDISRSTCLIHKSMDVDDYLRRIGDTVLALRRGGLIQG